MVVGEIASAISALVALAQLVLAQAQREPERVSASDEIRHGLLEFEAQLAEWARAAAFTNGAARDWASHLPSSAGDAEAWIRNATYSQRRFGRAVSASLRGPVEDTPENESRAAVTLAQLLHVYSPETADIGDLLALRGRLLRRLPEELERRYGEGRRRAVDEYLDELDSTLDQLVEARDAIAAFIVEHFPLNPA